MNVLLLEDEPDLSAVACEQIESRGHQVFPAFDIAKPKLYWRMKALPSIY